MTIITSGERKSDVAGLVTFLRGLRVDASLIRHPLTKEEYGYWEVAVHEQQRDIARHLYGVWLDRRRSNRQKRALRSFAG